MKTIGRKEIIELQKELFEASALDSRMLWLCSEALRGKPHALREVRRYIQETLAEDMED